MEEKVTSQQPTLVMHALLVGLTPLIPVPVVDDLAKQYLQQRLVRSLAWVHDVPLSDAELKGFQSITPAHKGCLSGCLMTALVYPFKKLARKIFFFLEIKRAVDLTSYSYHYGYLLDYALRQGWAGGAGGRSWAVLDTALDEVCRTAPIKPVEAAVRATFTQSKRLLLLPVNLISTQLERIKGPATPEKVKEGLRAARTEENQEALNSLAARLQESLASVPESHFAALRAQLAQKLNL